MGVLFEKFWGNNMTAIKPKSNSLSSKEEQLAEYREVCLDSKKQILIDRNGDPLQTWEPVLYDPRFPNTDITNWCITSWEDYYRCRHLRGPEYEQCNFFKNVFTQICPQHMIDKFERHRQMGIYLTLPPNQADL